MSAIGRLDRETCYRAVKSRDRRFDGVFYTGVHTTGIYCRPSCPARTPAYRNVSFFASAAGAQEAGFRACQRCLPDATPGSPDWDVAADVAGRAMRLISDGAVDRVGVEGLATQLGYTSRHLTRLLTSELGAGPLALARARRAQTARVLLETGDLGLADVAFAAGFASVRQFNDTIREVYATTPSRLRGRPAAEPPVTGRLSMRLAVRTPFAGRALLDFLATRAVPGVEETGPDWYARSLRLPHGPGTVRITLTDAEDPGRTALVPATFTLTDLRDTAAAVERVRRLIDADCDPVAVGEQFAGDPLIGPLVRRTPGLRVPGHVDGHEGAVRAVLGQQISVAGARTVAGRLVARHGAALPDPVGGLTRLFPDAATLAGVDPGRLPMPHSRGDALTGLCRVLADGDLALDRGDDRAQARRKLLALPGIGPWTAGAVAMRALGDPDVFLPTDVGVRRALEALTADGGPTVGRPDTEREGSGAAARSEQWRPWRSYALMYLWQSRREEDE